jgi:hypothetical protein
MPLDQPNGDPRPYKERLREWNEKKLANVRKRRFYMAIRHLLKRDFGLDDLGKLADPPKEEFKDPTEVVPQHDILKNYDDIGDGDHLRAQFLAIAGMLHADSLSDPSLGKSDAQLSEGAGDVIGHDPSSFDDEKKVAIAAAFVRRFVSIVQEYKTRYQIFDKVYYLLRKESTNGSKATFGARQVGEIGRQLINEGVKENDPQFKQRFLRALAATLSGATTGRASAIDIDLPDLEEGTEADIVKDNVLALSAVYFAAMLEELKFFSVMDKVVEQFMVGALPISRGTGGDALYRFFKEAKDRITEHERRGLYGRCFGLAQGSVEESMPNREFNDLWIRFLSAVSASGREITSTERKQVSDEQVFKSARDLAVNLSLHGYGLAHFAAVELQTLVKSIKTELSGQDILQAYGVKDIWQLVERVSNMYLGGAVNSVRQRTMAQSGAKIMNWLASKAPNLTGSSNQLYIDQEIISHAERWLAVTGTPDATVERYSEPVAVQSQRTIPDFGSMPNGEVLRDALSKLNNLPAIPQA